MLPQGPGYWALSRHRDVLDASRQPELFCSGKGSNIGDMPASGPGLQMAYNALVNADAAVKRVIMISDGDPAAGLQKKQMCEGCHGIVGYRTAYPSVYSAPKLGGQGAAYIVKALQGYRNGDRTHPSMRAIAAGLTDQDMADLAAYYSSTAARSASK